MTNQQGAPEALRLAAEVLDWMPTSDTQRALWDKHQEALAVVKAALVEAQQPAPSAAAAVEWIGVSSHHLLQRDGILGKAGDVVTARWPVLPQPSTTPQVDSAPGAVTVERAIQIAESLGVREYGPNTRNWSFDYAQLARFVAALTAPQADSQPAAQQKAPADELEEVLRERDDAEDFINELLDEVLGADRPEWSSAYNRYDAMNDVRERITALHKPAVDKAWGRFESAMAAPQLSPTPQADSVTAPVRGTPADLPPLPDPDLRDVGTTHGGIKAFLRGYATEYAKAALAARAPADPLQPMVALQEESGMYADDFAPKAGSQPAPAYSIDDDPQGIRARVADAITGALAFGAQGANPPPTGHWLVPFWETAREEASRNRPVSSDTLYLLRRLLSNQHTLTSAEFREELTKIVGEAAQAADSVPVAPFDGPKVQAVYAILCSDVQPPEGEHWEGFAARRIVDAISADSVLEDADPIRALIAEHAAILDQNESAYFELCYHRATGWMAWITDKPLCMPPVVNPDRKVLAQGQGDTADEACRDAARKQGGA